MKRGSLRASLAALLASASVLLVACGGSAPEPTPAPQAQAPAAEPTKVGADVIEKGKAAFNKYGCQACHAIKGFAEGQVGPALDNMYVVAQQRITSAEYKQSKGKAKTAEEYIRESILHPNDYIVPQCPTGPCPAGVMIQNFEQQITPEELQALIGYLMSLGR
ncbi:MAG: cytochrome c [Thermoflexales bacterium]|nr:cytochrome c [Thermoflexales bacterium]MCS7323863.1 cytochrome c [Thermoflexales bacterium]MCX7938842.1 cytochrome c [Thermoflexales bacterium]MDW8052977.1 cytochrome c [Anaerolineae bacterium]MDW8291630.1 cytochrome c [Anaerolineae bacterium]